MERDIKIGDKVICLVSCSCNMCNLKKGQMRTITNIIKDNHGKDCFFLNYAKISVLRRHIKLINEQLEFDF